MPSTGRPTPERPLLVGLMMDVSGSMVKAIDSSRIQQRSRLESLNDSLDELIRKGAELSGTGSDDRVAPLLRIFAYGFGFGGPLSFLIGSSGQPVRDLLDLGNGAETTVTIDKLADAWPTYRRHFGRIAREMLGSTPMREAFQRVQHRLEIELRSRPYHGTPSIFVLSDGDPTDAQPEQIVELANALKSKATIVSCFVTDADLTERRRLYGANRPQWSAGAELMFCCASPVPHDSSFPQYLHEYGWKVDDDARLFAQVNQSEMLSEFMNLILSPLRGDDPAPSKPGRVRVFVSYSHKEEDARYKSELLEYLQGLSR